MAKMDKKKKNNLSAFLLTLLSSIKIRVAFAFSCSYQYSEQEIISYFKNLIRARVNEFLKAHGQKHPQQERKIAFYLNKLPHLVKTYQIRMRQKALFFAGTGKKGKKE